MKCHVPDIVKGSTAKGPGAGGNKVNMNTTTKSPEWQECRTKERGDETGRGARARPPKVLERKEFYLYPKK